MSNRPHTTSLSEFLEAPGSDIRVRRGLSLPPPGSVPVWFFLFFFVPSLPEQLSYGFQQPDPSVPLS